MYRIETPTTSATITHLPCNVIPAHSSSPRLSSPIVVASNPAPEEFPDVGEVNQISSDKSIYAFNQAQTNIKIATVQPGYQSQYSIPPMILVPSTNSNTSSVTIGTDDIITTTASCSPIHDPNVGTILAENNAMLQNTPMATETTYSSSYNPSNNNFYSHHGHNQQEQSDNTLQYGTVSNPLR